MELNKTNKTQYRVSNSQLGGLFAQVRYLSIKQHLRGQWTISCVTIHEYSRIQALMQVQILGKEK